MYAEKVADLFFGNTFEVFVEKSIPDLKNKLFDNICAGNYETVSMLLPRFKSELLSLYHGHVGFAKSGAIFTWAQLHAVITRGYMSPLMASEIQKRYFRKLDVATSVEEVIELFSQQVIEFTLEMKKAIQEANCSPLVNSCCEYVRDNITKPLSVESIAEKMYFSTSYISRKFREEKGISLGQYIVNEKMRAAKLLLNGSTPIVEISEVLGYCSQSHFTKVFREETGTTPGKYRKTLFANQKEEQSANLSLGVLQQTK